MEYSFLHLNIADVKLNPNNPRVITKSQFDALKKSIEKSPKSLELSPLLINEDNVILGGNMRFRALRELGYEKIPCVKVIGLSEEKQRELIIKDNINFGDWDWNVLVDSWDIPFLSELGLSVPKLFIGDNTPREQDQDGTRDAFETWMNNEKGQIKLFYDNDTYNFVVSFFDEKKQDRVLTLQSLLDKYFEEHNLIKDKR